MVDQHSALRVKLSDLIEGMNFQLRMTNRSKTFRNGSMTRFGLLRTWWKRLTISHYPTDLRSTGTRSWSGSVSRWMLRTCGMICVTPYVVEARSGVLRIGFRRMGWLRRGTGIGMQHCERLPWRGVRSMVLPIQNKGGASWVSLNTTPAMRGKRLWACCGA